MKNEIDTLWRDYLKRCRVNIEEIVTINFIDHIPTFGMLLDISYELDGSVLCSFTGSTLDIYTDGKLVLPKDSGGLFENFKKLEQINGMENVDTSLCEDMLVMFKNCNSLKSLDLSHNNLENVKYITFMFRNCNSLEKLILSKDCHNDKFNELKQFEVVRV